jgi:hypothetical protein
MPDGSGSAPPPIDMATKQRASSLAQRVIAHLKRRPAAQEAVGASPMALDKLESRLMVELPPSLRQFLQFDFTFASLGPKFHGKARFGTSPEAPRPRITSLRKLAEAKTDLGWTDSRIRGKVVRLPNLPGQPWNALYLGEARRDGELVILGLENEDTLVRAFVRYTAFDLYLCEQVGLARLTEAQRLDDLESHVALNPELGAGEEEEDAGEADY